MLYNLVNFIVATDKKFGIGKDGTISWYIKEELKYFKDSWKPDYSKFKYSGWALLDKIKDTAMILDIGCGYNLFKEKNSSLLTLEDALKKFPEIYFNIDLKVSKVIQDSIRVVSDLNAFDRVCFASFHSSHTKKILQHNQNAIVSMSMKDVALFKFFKIYNKNIKVIQIPLEWKGIKLLTRSFMQKAHKNNLLVHIWTINDRATINNLIDIGVNGIITDEPELLMEIMKERDLISD